MNPFDFVKSINETKEDLMIDEMSEKSYAPFLVNRTLSYFNDTVFQANEMNLRSYLDKKIQYQFLINTIRPRKRFGGKWHKVEIGADLQSIMTYYGYSEEKARQVLPLFTSQNLKELKKLLDPGGIKE
jgi:clamp loader A subunit